MAHVYNWVIDGEAPFTHIDRILTEFWEGELRRYVADPDKGHLFRDLVAVANWLNTVESWTPEDYVRAWEHVPQFGWRVGGMYDLLREDDYWPDSVQLEEENGPRGPALHPLWCPVGVDSNYVICGRSARVTAVVGWNSGLRSFFAQVWENSEEVEDGRLGWGTILQWVGKEARELPRVEDLEAALDGLVDIPEPLKCRLAQDSKP
jgi:hypothetical protein